MVEFLKAKTKMKFLSLIIIFTIYLSFLTFFYYSLYKNRSLDLNDNPLFQNETLNMFYFLVVFIATVALLYPGFKNTLFFIPKELGEMHNGEWKSYREYFSMSIAMLSSLFLLIYLIDKNKKINELKEKLKQIKEERE